MNENQPTIPSVVQGGTAPMFPAKPPFTANWRERVAAFGMYIAAYLYIEHVFFSDAQKASWIAVFTALFVLLTELVHWRQHRSWESWVWLGCLAVILGSMLLGRARVWGEIWPVFFLHFCAVYWVLSRSGKLLEGESGHLLPVDAFDGFVLFPFKHFFLRIRTIWNTLTHLRPKGEKAKPETIFWSVFALLIAAALFVFAAKLLGKADSTFQKLLRGWADFFTFDWGWEQREILDQFLLSLPVAAYLFGLIGGSGREDTEKLRQRGASVCKTLTELRKVPTKVWTILTAAFCVLYAAFFVVQAQYLFGAFTRTLPKGFSVAQYARQGFFELCKVMAVNFVVLWLVTRLSRTPVRERKAARIACLALLGESMLFAVIAFSKLVLYINCFGFTPLRLQSSWLVCVLFFGCGCAVYALVTGKRSFRVWLMFSAVSLSLLHLY